MNDDTQLQDMAVTLEKISPPKELTETDQDALFQYIFRRLAAYRNAAELHALAEFQLSSMPHDKKQKRKDQFSQSLNDWAQGLVDKAWMVCGQPGGDECPELDELADTSVGDLPEIPPERLSAVLNAVLFLTITTSKQYSARTRSFLFTNFPREAEPDEEVIVTTLKNPDQVLREAQTKAEASREDHARKGKALRYVGMGLAAVGGGVLVGVTGGLAAPLIGASITTIFGWLGIGGSAVGLLASGLAGSSAICGALFGVYGAKSTANMVERHTREIRDLAIVPVSSSSSHKDETLGVRLCISGWLTSAQDVTAPWSVFGGDDTLALQWEVKALEALSNALYALIKTNSMKYLRAEVIRRTVFASLMASLAPIALLNIGQIIDNPWMNTKALAVKAGAVLGDLISKRVFGNRPLVLIGYSFGSLCILEALKHVASLPPSETLHLVQDVFLFGTPASTDPAVWSSIRRLVAGRLVNGYSNKDYVLAVLSRASDVSWQVAGLQAVDVQGIENVLFEDIDGHTQWRGMIGKCLREIGAPGIKDNEVDAQLKDATFVVEEQKMTEEEAEEVLKKGELKEGLNT